jgi:uncharacterized membrane protein
VTLELLLAKLLRNGTWLASIVIALGIARGDWPLVSAGIALTILLPVARVTVMLVAFTRARDYRLAALSALVLLAIAAAATLGRTASMSATETAPADSRNHPLSSVTPNP